jgi:hypothetical protein
MLATLSGVGLATLVQQATNCQFLGHLMQGQLPALGPTPGETPTTPRVGRHFAIEVLRVAALVELVVLASLVAAHATEPPEAVAQEIGAAVQVCEKGGDKPNTSAVLSAEDLNGDGVEDWIADYSKFECEGVTNRNCLTKGCTLQIFYWDGKTDWVLEYQDIVQSYKFGKWLP